MSAGKPLTEYTDAELADALTEQERRVIVAAPGAPREVVERYEVLRREARRREEHDERAHTRDWQRTDRTYVTPSGAVFWTEDGEGRHYYDTVAEAVADGAPEHVEHLSFEPQ